MRSEVQEDEPWKGDLLNRQAEATLLERFLRANLAERRELGRIATYVLNLDAGWGQGKSFFLRSWCRDLQQRGERVAYVDAWAHDYADDPLLAVVSGIEKCLHKQKAKQAKNATLRTGARLVGLVAKHAGRAALAHMIGPDGKELAEEVTEAVAKEGFKAVEEVIDKSSEAIGKKLTARFEQTKATVEAFKKELAAAISEGAPNRPLLVFVDELDRCRPPYAIALLERIKHFFDVDGVVFVVATDTSQLHHSIGAVYGSGFDARGYLLRFFDRTYRFAAVSAAKRIESLFLERPVPAGQLRVLFDYTPETFFHGVCVSAKLTLREQERCFDMLQTGVRLWSKNWRLEMPYLLALIVAQCRQDDALLYSLSIMDCDPKSYKSLSQADYNFSFSYRDGFELKLTQATWVDLLVELFTAAQKPLPDIAGLKDAGPVRAWVNDGFREEYHVGHRNAWQRTKPMSSVCEYPELVRAVGRFTDGADLPAN